MLTWTMAFVGNSDADWLLEEGELAQVTVPISATNNLTLNANDEFMIEVKPPQGGVVPIMR